MKTVTKVCSIKTWGYSGVLLTADGILAASTSVIQSYPNATHVWSADSSGNTRFPIACLGSLSTAPTLVFFFFTFEHSKNGIFTDITNSPWEQCNPNGTKSQMPSGRARCFRTFLAVVLVFVQHKSIAALTHVASHRVDAFMLTPTVVLGAFIFVWQKDDPQFSECL